MDIEKHTSTIGTVFLTVMNLEKQIQFYTNVIGLKVQNQDEGFTYLGVGDEPLLGLVHKPSWKRVNHVAGLYHFALLVPSRYHLAVSTQRLIETQTPIQGASDHIVSESVYLADPEGNGIEIYRDRPEENWYRDGQFQLATLPLKFDEVMAELNGKDDQWNGLDAQTTMGHIHLHVRSISETQSFYGDLLCFDEMVNIRTATFLSYNGYHHHIGANTWGGTNPPPDDALGLLKYQLRVPNDKLVIILGNLEKAGVPVEASGNGILVRDPAENLIELNKYH